MILNEKIVQRKKKQQQSFKTKQKWDIWPEIKKQKKNHYISSESLILKFKCDSSDNDLYLYFIQLLNRK